jgi:hypothetical protein
MQPWQDFYVFAHQGIRNILYKEVTIAVFALEVLRTFGVYLYAKRIC